MNSSKTASDHAIFDHLPRIRAYLRKTLRHPALAEVAGFYEQHGILEERTP